MRILSFMLSGFALVPWVAAQVSIEVVLEQDQFLPSESVVAAVRITNFSGQTLHLGKEDDWLRFSVEARDGYVVSKQDDPPVKGEFDVESSKVATKRVDVAPHFSLTKPGRYLITATVKLAQWDKELSSKPREFDVIAGTRLWEQEFGVRRTAGDTNPPEVRKYALQQAIHLKQMKLYVRVTDQSESHIFRVFPIGPMVSFSQPEKQIDHDSNLHVLYQTGARKFNYSLISPDGRLIIRRTYEYSDTRPVLRIDREGRIVVIGGVRRVSPDDLPAPSETSTPDNDGRTTRP